MVSVKVDPEKCNGDAICISVCPTNVFDFVNNKAVANREQDCILCMACVAQCPTQAITVKE